MDLSFYKGPDLTWNESDTYLDLFYQAVHQKSNNTISDDDGEYTLSELNALSNGIAGKLTSSNVNCGDYVIIKIPRSRILIAAMLGVMKAGAAFYIYERNIPADIYNTITDILTPKIIIDNKWMSNIIPNETDIDNSSLKSRAYVIFTSGTTGKPKGVIHTHYSLSASIHAAFQRFNLYGIPTHTTHSTTFSISSLSWVLDSFFHILYSSSLLVLSYSSIHNTSEFLTSLKKHNISSLFCTPTLYKLISSIPMDYLELGGEKITTIKKTDNIKLIINKYGCSEFGCITSNLICDNNSITAVGKVDPGEYVFITDNALNPLGIYQTGEVVLSGPQMAEEYINNPLLTKEKFGYYPLINNRRIYKTGDLAYYDDNKTLHIVGRVDNQVKIGGYRVEIEDIESHISNICGIKDSMIKIFNRGENNQVICGYYISESISENELSELLSKTLPDYMIPHVLIRLSSFPLDANGKKNRAALEYPQISFPTADHKRNTNEFELALFNAVCNELDTCEVGINDDLISLGITSLSAMYIQSSLEKIGYHLPSGGIMIYQLFKDKKTIREIAKYISHD